MKKELAIGNIEIKYKNDELAKENLFKFIIQYLVDKELVRGDELDPQ